MKKLKNTKKKRTSNERKNDFINFYFENFKNKNTLIDKYKIKIDEIIKAQDLIDLIKNENPVPGSGKNTRVYWISRGWSRDEAEEKRTIIKIGDKSPMRINNWLNKINTKTNKYYTEEEAKYKIKSFRKMNVEYWLERGYSEQESVIKVSEHQREQANKYSKKLKTNPENYDDIHEHQLKFWLKKGFTKKEAKNKVSERQTTFSKEICIEKYGEIKGLKRWQKRQDKWQNTLKYNSDYNGVDGKGFTVKDKIDKYDIDIVINSLSLKNRKIFKILLNEHKDIESFISGYVKMIDDDLDEISLYRILRPLIGLKLLQTYYNTTRNHILSLVIPKISRIKSRYSYISWFNGHICRSDSEYIIATFLFKNDIEYVYEKYYKNTRKRTDFYLPKYDLYIEYLGMELSTYKDKINFLKQSNYNYLTETNVNKLKQKILNYVNNKN